MFEDVGVCSPKHHLRKIRCMMLDYHSLQRLSEHFTSFKRHRIYINKCVLKLRVWHKTPEKGPQLGLCCVQFEESLLHIVMFCWIVHLHYHKCFLLMFNPPQILNFIQGNNAFQLVTCGGNFWLIFRERGSKWWLIMMQIKLCLSIHKNILESYDSTSWDPSGQKLHTVHLMKQQW